MTLEERLQGEWLIGVDEQCREETWSINIRGRQIDFESDIGALSFVGEEATLELKNGNRLVINRQRAPGPNLHDPKIPVVIVEPRGTVYTGWTFRSSRYETLASSAQNEFKAKQ